MTNDTAPNAEVRWKVITQHNGTHVVTAATWEHKMSTEMVEFSNGGSSCAAAFDRREIVAILEISAASAVTS